MHRGSFPKLVVLVTIVAIFNLYAPFETFAQAKKLAKSSKDESSVLAEFDGERIQWKVVFSPGHGNVSKELAVDVGAESQLFMSITSLESSATPPKKATLLAETPKGAEIGRRGKKQDDETKALGLEKMPDAKPSPTIEKLGRALEVQEGKGGRFDPRDVVGDEELAAAAKEYEQEMKKSENAGFLHIPEDRFEGEGFQALQIVNPTEKGKWKMKVKGAKGEPFVAVAMAVPIEMTDADRAVLRDAAAQISSAVRTAFPGFQQWDVCTGCCACVTVLVLGGIVGTIAGIVLGIGGVVLAALQIWAVAGLLLGIVGVAISLIGLVGVAAAVIATALAAKIKANWFCMIENSARVLCLMMGFCGHACEEICGAQVCMADLSSSQGNY